MFHLTQYFNFFFWGKNTTEKTEMKKKKIVNRLTYEYITNLKDKFKTRLYMLSHLFCYILI